MARGMGCIYRLEAMAGEGDVEVVRIDIKLHAEQLVSCQLLALAGGERKV